MLDTGKSSRQILGVMLDIRAFLVPALESSEEGGEDFMGFVGVRPEGHDLPLDVLLPYMPRRAADVVQNLSQYWMDMFVAHRHPTEYPATTSVLSA